MMYVAKCYVSIAGRVLRPGDAFQAETEDAKIARMLRLNAIAPVKPSFASETADMQPDDSKADGNSADGGTDAENEVDDEAEIDEESPEIDGMDGIVPESDQESADTEKPARKTNRRTKA